MQSSEVNIRRNKTMKKLLAILTASVCVFAMAACGSKEDNTLVMATNAEFPP